MDGQTPRQALRTHSGGARAGALGVHSGGADSSLPAPGLCVRGGWLVWGFQWLGDIPRQPVSGGGGRGRRLCPMPRTTVHAPRGPGSIRIPSNIQAPSCPGHHPFSSQPALGMTRPSSQGCSLRGFPIPTPEPPYRGGPTDPAFRAPASRWSGTTPARLSLWPRTSPTPCPHATFRPGSDPRPWKVTRCSSPGRCWGQSEEASWRRGCGEGPVSV